MQVDAMGLLFNSAMALKPRDPATAYALLEMANHLRLVMRGDASLDDWNAAYVGADKDPFDLNALLPVSAAADHT
jgi:hypothetical protein